MSTNQTIMQGKGEGEGEGEGEVIVPESRLAFILHAVHFTNGFIGLVGNGVVAFVILTPFLHHFFPRLYACLSCQNIQTHTDTRTSSQVIPVSIIKPTSSISRRITKTQHQSMSIPRTTVISEHTTDDTIGTGASPISIPTAPHEHEPIISRTTLTRSSQSSNLISTPSPKQSTRIHARTLSSQVIPHEIPEEIEMMMDNIPHITSVQIEQVDQVTHVRKDQDGDITISVPSTSISDDAKSQPRHTLSLSPPPITSTHSTLTTCSDGGESEWITRSYENTSVEEQFKKKNDIDDEYQKMNIHTTSVQAINIHVHQHKQEDGIESNKQRNLSPVTFLMGMQAVVDIILITQTMVVALQHIISPGWRGGSFGFDCQSNGFMTHLLSCISISNLVFIAYERHSTIVYSHFLTLGTTVRYHILCWIVSICVNIIPLISLSLPKHQQTWVGLYVLHPSIGYCFGFGRNVHMLITSILYSGFGMMYLLYAYIHIFIHVHSTIRTTQTITTYSSQTLIQQNKQHETRIGMLMFLFSAVFFACWAPAVAEFMYYQFMGDQHVDTIWDAILFTMGTASVIFNPYVYGMIDPRVRQFAKRLFCNCCQFGIRSR